MASSLHVSIAAEPIIRIGQFAISNSILTSLIVSALLIILAITANSRLESKGAPKGLQNILEMIIDGFYNLVHGITESASKTAFIFPITLTFFLFILINNWLGLLPGVGSIGIFHQGESETVQVDERSVVPAVQAVTHGPEAIEEESLESTLGEDVEVDQDPGSVTVHENEEESAHEIFTPIFRAGTADLNTTLALAIFSMGAVQFIGFRTLGLSYLSKFFNFKNAIFTFVGLLELVSEFAKVISFTFRLFGNIFAGEVLLAVIAWLIPAIAPIPFLFLEIFVGVIQALVFAMLSIVFMNMATQGHAEEH